IFHHKGKNLGFLLKELPEEKAGLLVVKLQPCGSASGRFVDQDGKPVAGSRVALHGAGDVTTDKDGRFRAEGLIPGMKYDLFHPIALCAIASPFGVRNLGKIEDGGR